MARASFRFRPMKAVPPTSRIFNFSKFLFLRNLKMQCNDIDLFLNNTSRSQAIFYSSEVESPTLLPFFLTGFRRSFSNDMWHACIDPSTSGRGEGGPCRFSPHFIDYTNLNAILPIVSLHARSHRKEGSLCSNGDRMRGFARPHSVSVRPDLLDICS